MFLVFTCRAALLATSGGPIFRCTFFTYRSTLPTVSDGPIFRCTTKDRGERRASSSQAPHPSFCLSGQKLSRSAAPPLPTKPTSLGFGGAPIGGPRWIPEVMFWAILTCCVRTFSPKGTSFGRATVHLTRLSRLRCREANTLGVRCRLSPCLCVLRVRLN